MLTKEIATQMVEQTMIRLNRNINVMDLNGLIFASGERVRLHHIHEGAAHVARTGETLIIRDDQVNMWPGSKAGINLPLWHDEKMIAVIGITGDPNDLESVAPLVQLTCELMLHQSIVTAESEWKRKWKDDAITELMMTDQFSQETLQRASLSHLSLHPPLCCIVFTCKKEQTNTLRRRLEDFLDWSDKLVGVGINGELVLVLSRLEEDRIVEKISRFLPSNSSVKAAIGKTVSSTHDLHISLRTALVAKSNQQSSVMRFSEIELNYLLALVPVTERDAFVFSMLESLDEKAQETLYVLFTHNLSIRLTAEALDIHRHTLSYRLQQIQEKTGLDPLKFLDATKLWLALEWSKDREDS